MNYVTRVISLHKAKELEVHDYDQSEYSHVRVIFDRNITVNEIDEIRIQAKGADKLTMCLSGASEDDFDLSFLEVFPELYGFDLNNFYFKSFSELKNIPSTIKSLKLSETNSKKLSLRFIHKFKTLKELYIERHKKDFDEIGKLKQLESLIIRSMTLPSLQPIIDLNKNIISLDIKLGGTSDLSLLPAFEQLKYLELWRISKIENLSMIGDTHSLQYIFLQAMKNVHHLPNFERMHNLRRLTLLSMKGVSDLSNLVKAPVLEDLTLSDMNQLNVEDFCCLVNHRSLQVLRARLGSKKKDIEIEKMFKLPCELSKFKFI